MGVSGGSITFCRFQAEHRAEAPKDLRRWLSRGFKKDAFEPLERGSDEDRAAGWVELDDRDATELSPSKLVFGEYAIASYRVDKLQLPKQAVNAELEAWSRAFAEKNGKKPARAELREQKELTIKKLRQRAFIATRIYDVSWNLRTDEVLIWAGSRKAAEEVQICMEEAFSIHLVPASPASLAARLGHDVSKLAPTPELIGFEVSAGEAESRVA